jgi:hypothetical protein
MITRKITAVTAECILSLALYPSFLPGSALLFQFLRNRKRLTPFSLLEYK